MTRGKNSGIVKYSIRQRMEDEWSYGAEFSGRARRKREIGRLVDSCALFAQNGMYMMSHGQKAM